MMQRIHFLNRQLHLLTLGLLLLSCGGQDKNGFGMSSLEDIADKRVGVLVGSIHDRYVQEHFPQAKLIYVDYTPDLGPALETGKCDVFIHNEEVVRYFLKNYPDMGILCKNIRSEELGFGFNKKNTALRESFNAFLAELQASGELKQIVARWRDHFDETPPPELSGDGSGGVLRFGTSGVDIPCSSIRDGLPAGYDVEIIYRFASKHNMRVDLQRIPFGGLIAALASGKVDVIANGMVITQERAKQIDFSDPYTQKGIDVVALKKNIAVSNAPASGTGGKFRGVEDIADKRIGVWVGSVYDKYTQEHFPKAHVVHIDATPDLVLSLINDKCDVFMIHSELAAHFMAQYPEVGLLAQYPDTDTLAYGFSYNNPALHRKFNAFLAETGWDTLQAICNKWAHHFTETPPPILGGDGSGGVLRLGTTGTDVPCSSVREGKPAGYDIEIVYRFAAANNMRVEINRMPFGALIAALSSGKVDIIGNGIMITPERKKQVNFSTPYRIRNFCFLALKKNIASYDKTGSGTPKMTGLDDVRNKHLGVLMGSIHDLWAARNLPQAKLIRGDSSTDLVTALQARKVDAILLNSMSARVYLEKHPEMGLLQADVLRDSIGFGFHKNNPKLLAAFNNYLARIRAEGELARILNQWENDFDHAIPPVVTGDGSGGVLRIGTTGVNLPYSIVKDGKPAGSDIEILFGFASSQNMRVEIRQMTFGALIPSLQSGKVDVIASSIGMTPERARAVAFSDCYQSIPVDLLAMREDIASTDGSDDTVPQKPGFFRSIAEGFRNNLIAEKRYMIILDGLWTTLIITLFSVLFGTFLGGLICLMRMSRSRFWRSIGNVYVSILAGTPVLVFLMIMFYVVFAKLPVSPTLVAIIALALAFGAYVSGIYKTSIETIDRGQTEAGTAMGFTKIGTFRHIIFPQALRVALPLYKAEVIAMLKTTAIVGYIAVEDLTKAGDIIRSRTFDAFFPLIMVALIYFTLAWLLKLLLERLSRNTDPRQRLQKTLRQQIQSSPSASSQL